jgi:hypothetical protein
VPDFPGAGPGPFFACVADGGGTDTEHARRVSEATRLQRHVDDLTLHLRRLPGVGIIQQKRAPASLSALPAAIALFAFPGTSHAGQ